MSHYILENWLILTPRSFLHTVPLLSHTSHPSYTQVLAQSRQALCQQCLLSIIDLKIRNIVRGRGLIQDDDSIAVAFSGGPSSSMLLHFLANIKAASIGTNGHGNGNGNGNGVHQYPDKGRVRFKLHILHVAQLEAEDREEEGEEEGEEDKRQQQRLSSPSYHNDDDDDDKIYKAADAALQSSTVTPGVHICPDADIYFHTVKLASLFERASHNDNNTHGGQHHQKQQKLNQLLCTIKDATGREDTLSHLTWHLLIQTATHLGCSKLLRADTSTRLAVRTIAAVSKGQGYTLPAEAGCIADLRYAKYLNPQAPIVLYPMRDVGMKYVALASHYLKLPTVHSSLAEVVGQIMKSRGGNDTDVAVMKLVNHPTSINVFTEGFVAGLQEQNPGAAGNVLAVVGRLVKFPWTDPPLLIDRENKKKKEKKEKGGNGEREREREAEVIAVGNVSKKASVDNAGVWLNNGGGGGNMNDGESVCSLCFNPLAPGEEEGGGDGVFCSCCQVQILGGQGEDIVNMLPLRMYESGGGGDLKKRKMTEEEMREMLGECILSD
jgi:hypothetical protein